MLLGARGSGGSYNGKNGSKFDVLDLGLTKGTEPTLEIEPAGNVVLGKKGITLSCQSSGDNQHISWLYNGVPAPPCGIARCALLPNGSLHFYKVVNILHGKYYLIDRWSGKHIEFGTAITKSMRESRRIRLTKMLLRVGV